MDKRRIRVWFQDDVDFLDLPSNWDSMSARSQEEYLSECGRTHMENHADYGGELSSTEDKEYTPGMYSDTPNT